MTKTTKTQCDGMFSQCKRNATVTIAATAFTAELKFCRQHSQAFVRESLGFHSRNA